MMDKFEEKLLNLKIPEISDKFLEYDLKERLEQKLFYQKFKLPYRIAFGSALVMFLFTLSIVIKPDLADSINNKIRGKSAEQIAEVTEPQPNNNQLAPTPEWTGFEGLALLEKETVNSLSQDNSTSVRGNGELEPIQNLHQDDFEEGKVYMIRKYKSPDQQGIIMINEMENSSSSKGVIRKIRR